MAADRKAVEVIREVPPAVMDMANAGKYIGRSPWFVRRKIYDGTLRGFKFNGKGRLMVLRSSLDEFIASECRKQAV